MCVYVCASPRRWRVQALNQNGTVRPEPLQERLGKRHRELGIPLLLEWPDGRREAILATTRKTPPLLRRKTGFSRLLRGSGLGVKLKTEGAHDLHNRGELRVPLGG